nr:unnamed protein product [Naegleria fowleri]
MKRTTAHRISQGLNSHNSNTLSIIQSHHNYVFNSSSSMKSNTIFFNVPYQNKLLYYPTTTSAFGQIRSYTTATNWLKEREASTNDSNDPSPSSSEQICLDLTNYESWNAQQVASVLTSPKSLGGAGLSVDDVKPLYEAGFKGTSLHIIVENIKMDDVKYAIDQLKSTYNENNIPQLSDTCQTIVLWVNTQFLHKLQSNVQSISVPLLSASDFLIPSLNAYNALSLVDITNNYQVDQKDTLIYRHPLLGGIEIFNNLVEFKTIQDRFKLICSLHSLRGRPSFEIHGNARTGKTHCARFIVPYYITKAMNEQRLANGDPVLKLCPVIYTRFTNKENCNHLKEIYDSLQPIREALNIDDRTYINPDYKTLIARNITKFGKYSPNCHLFIVLDEIQFIDSTILDTLREIAKSQDLPYRGSTFILTGSTQARFVRVLASTVKNGLSYNEATIQHTIPYDLQNSTQIEELCRIRNIPKPSDEDLCLLQERFRGLNIAYLTQILALVSQNISIDKAAYMFINEIFDIYDRDIFVPLTKKPLTIDRNLELVMNQLLPIETISSQQNNIFQFASTYLTKETRIVNGISIDFYKFRDIMLEYYLTTRLHKREDGTYYLSNIEYKPHSLDTTIDNIASLGEKIARWKHYNRNNNHVAIQFFQNNFQLIQNFLQNDPALTKLSNRNINNLHQELNTIINKHHTQIQKAYSSFNTLPKQEKLAIIFIQTRNIIRHEHVTSSPATTAVANAYLAHFLNGDRHDFHRFSIRIYPLLGLPM